MKAIIAAILVLFLMSCKDKPTVQAPDIYNNAVAGSSWNYKLITASTGGSNTTNFTVTSTTRDTMINSKNYHVFTSSQGNNIYRLKLANDYYEYTSLNFGTPLTFEKLYLKDNISVGQIWVQNIAINLQGFPITLVQSNTILEKGITKTIGGTAYSKVIHVQTQYILPPLPGISFTGSEDSYYAPNYGLIAQNFNYKFSMGGTMQATSGSQEIVSAVLK